MSSPLRHASANHFTGALGSERHAAILPRSSCVSPNIAHGCLPHAIIVASIHRLKQTFLSWQLMNKFVDWKERPQIATDSQMCPMQAESLPTSEEQSQNEWLAKRSSLLVDNRSIVWVASTIEHR
jgi:hypothetical protein